MGSFVIIDGLPDFQRRLAAISNVGDIRFMRDIANEVVVASRRLAPEDTGALKASISVRSVQAMEAEVGAGGGAVNYAAAQEFGAGGHEIKARRARRLRFFWEREQRMFVGFKVQHPGNPPHPYFRPVVDTLNLALRVSSDIVSRWNKAA